MKKYQYFLFDWDGNLAQSLDVWLGCLKQGLERRGHRFTDKEIGADFSLFVERMQQKDVRDIDRIVEEATLASEELLPYVDLYPDVVSVLESLQLVGKKLALVTTSKHSRIDVSLAHHNLDRFFDAVICGDDVTNSKPSAEPIEKALSLLGADQLSTIMIGDSDKDILAAANAGIDSVLFHPERHASFYDLDALKQLRPTYVVADLKDITRLA